MPEDLTAWVRTSMKELEITEAPITTEVALAVRSLKFAPGDPADHFLAASAQIFDLTLVTADNNLARVPGIRTMTNH